jgi:hypothetical protein
MPALPLDEAGKYVAGAYTVFLAIVVIYVAIMSTRLRSLEARLRKLDRPEEEAPAAGSPSHAAPGSDQEG